MSYCINPQCPNPKNPPKTRICQACGSSLILKDRYLVVRSLGQGGFGATFLAADISLPGTPPCVIKQLRPSSNVPQVFQMARELFEREAQTLGRIGNHPQVPRLLDYFEHNQQFYLIQEYVKGKNLQEEVKKNGVFSEAGLKQFLSEILPMLQYIHSHQVIHRDIKPANLIRREQDRKLVLIDFGAVKNQVNVELAENSSEQTALTSFAVGTPGFAPPEQMAMRPVYASDVYALGATCLYLLTGKSPKEMGYNPATGEMDWQKYVNISDHLAKVLQKMLEVSVRHRYQSAQEVLDALEMEPYMDSLAQGLVAKPTQSSSDDPKTGIIKSFNTGQTNISSGESHTIGHSQLADAIRNRRARRPSLEGGAFSPVNRNRSFDSNLGSRPPSNPPKSTAGTYQRAGGAPKATPQGQKKVPQRLTEQEIVIAYRNGRRDFTDQNLSYLKLPDVDLSGAIFHQSKLNKTNFQGANLSSADFGRASLVQANLQNANLGRAYFSASNLEGADFRGADLSFAYFSKANLKGVNFCGANLANAKITPEQLALTKTNWATIKPDGKRGGFW